MLVDIFSSFDDLNFTFLSLSFIVWIGCWIIFMMVLRSFWLRLDKINIILIMFLDFFYSQSLSTRARYLTGYMSLLIGLFVTLIILNILGLVPYIFSTTAHLAITLRIALPLWFVIILSRIFYNLKNWSSHYVRPQSAVGLGWSLAFLELISVTIRPLTLSVRIMANLTAGHIIMGLIGCLLSSSIIGVGVVTWRLVALFQIIYTMFEILIIVVQAYVIVILLALYRDEHPY